MGTCRNGCEIIEEHGWIPTVLRGIGKEKRNYTLYHIVIGVSGMGRLSKSGSIGHTSEVL